jgi:hypothetical protein
MSDLGAGNLRKDYGSGICTHPAPHSSIVYRIWHRLQHWFGSNNGTIEVWTDPDGQEMAGFLCECGELQDVYPVNSHLHHG